MALTINCVRTLGVLYPPPLPTVMTEGAKQEKKRTLNSTKRISYGTHTTTKVRRKKKTTLGQTESDKKVK